MNHNRTVIYRVLPGDTDSYEIVHHPNYFVWFEYAIREDMLSRYEEADGICNITCEIIDIRTRFITAAVEGDLIGIVAEYKGSCDDGQYIEYDLKCIREQDHRIINKAHARVKADYERRGFYKKYY
jgi:acyl-CoA thioesterase FadM